MKRFANGSLKMGYRLRRFALPAKEFFDSLTN